MSSLARSGSSSGRRHGFATGTTANIEDCCRRPQQVNYYQTNNHYNDDDNIYIYIYIYMYMRMYTYIYDNDNNDNHNNHNTWSIHIYTYICTYI